MVPMRSGGDPARPQRDPRPEGPVVLVAVGSPPDLAALEAIGRDERWPLVRARDAGSAGRAASMRRASLVVVIGDDPRFAVEVVRAVRRLTPAPAAVVGGLDAMTRTRVLADGADIVLPAGLDPHELRAGVVALLRRAADTGEPNVRYLSAGELQVDLWSRTCRLRGAEVALSPTEFRLLVYLMRHPHRTLPRLAIVRRLWGATGGAHDLNALRIQVSRLRRKITLRGRAAPLIRSVRGVGYEFTENVLELGDEAHGGDPSEPSSLVLPRSVLEVARGLLARSGTAPAAAFLTEALVAAVGCDAAAVFRRRAHRLELVAERGNTDRWRSAIGGGVPLRSSFAQVHAIQTRQPTQVADIQGGPYRYTETARALAADGFHSCLFVPIVSETGSWGGLGLASRSRRPFDPAATTFCVAAAAMLALALRPPPGASGWARGADRLPADR